MIKMIVVDLDGTLLTSDVKVSNYTKEYLKKLKDRGYVIVIATGRIYASALEVTDGAGFVDYVITDTGGCIYRVIDNQALLTNFINKEVVINFFDYYKEDCLCIDICNKDNIYRYSDKIKNTKIIHTIKDKDYIINISRDISHCTIEMNNKDAVWRTYEDLRNKYGNEVEVIIMQNSFGDRRWIEVMGKGSSKIGSIRKLANYLNIDNSEIMAFGDGLNDIEMLEGVGHGVAMVNALEEVKIKAADITFFDYNHDGVVDYLSKFLK